MFFLALVGAPVLRELEDPALRRRIFGALGRRFRTAGWWAIGILLGTGVLNLYFRGLLDRELLASPDFWSGAYGRALAWKLAAVAAMLATSALHDFVFGPRASSGKVSRVDAPDGSRTDRDRRIAGWLARLNALFGIALVVAAVRLARGG